MRNDALTFAREYLDTYTDYKQYWNYEDGCVLKGCVDLFRACGEQAFRDYVLAYCDRRVGKYGAIDNYDYREFSADACNAGKALFFALDETGDQRYRWAIEQHMDRLARYPRCACGNFWHKERYPWQIWLDGLYMVQPFYARYEMCFDEGRQVPDILNQFQNVRKFLFVDEKQLYVHGYDEKRVQPWANKETGKSPNFWLRSMGWYLMALADCIAELAENKEAIACLTALFREAVDGILRYQDESGLFYQLIDLPNLKGNYTESSGTAMVACAIMRGVRLGALDESRRSYGIRAFEGLCREKLIKGADGRWHLKDICRVAGLGPGEKRDGSAAYYLSEEICEDDAKGVGPFMMALSEYLQV